MLGAIFHRIPLGDRCLVGFREDDLKLQQISLIIVVLGRIMNPNEILQGIIHSWKLREAGEGCHKTY